VETSQIIVPLLVAIGVLTVFGTLAPVLLGRKKAFKLGEYSLMGGAVCPRCQFPYSRNLLAPSLLVGKLQRCPHCGKWAVVPRASQAALNAAEARFQAKDAGHIESSVEEDDYKKLLDESRFER
jgi:hypothetical protein